MPTFVCYLLFQYDQSPQPEMDSKLKTSLPICLQTLLERQRLPKYFCSRLINAQTVGLIEFKLLHDNSDKLRFNIVLETVSEIVTCSDSRISVYSVQKVGRHKIAPQKLCTIFQRKTIKDCFKLIP